MTGKVYLVGAGPGDAKLLTLRAADLLNKADVVLYDRLVSKSVLAMIPKGTERVYVGRAVGDDTAHQNSTNDLMAQYAKKKRHIVRLKGGDPIIFGRGGEEAEFLKSKNIRYEIVPGITSGIGSAAYSGIPLTHRRYSSSVVFVTGHEDPTKLNDVVKWENLAKSVDTIVIMMGLSRINKISKHLIKGGMYKTTPVAVIYNGTTKKQRTLKGDLSNIARRIKEEGIAPPANIIIGDVVKLGSKLEWR